MLDFEQAYFDGWRYLKLEPRIIDRMTHRELYILLRAQTESTYDEYENMAHSAIMVRQAYHAQKLKFSDLFSRPLDVVKAKNRQKELLDQKVHTEEWLGQFRFVANDAE